MAERAPPMEHEDSVDGQDGKTKVKSRRPANTAFRQQRLKAWQPILTPKTVLPLFFAIAVIFAPIGGLLLYASGQVQEIVLDYSHCFDEAPASPATAVIPSDKVQSHFKKNSSNPDASPPTWSTNSYIRTFAPGVDVPTTQCSINFTIPNDMHPPVLFYYRLTSFYQNHRRYAKSFDVNQLKGDAVSASGIDGGDCSPLTSATINGTKLPYYPCGLAANSLFNDTFYSPVLLNVPISGGETLDSQTYEMQSDHNIAWSSDKKLYGQTKYNWSQVAVPPNWQPRYQLGYTDDNHPDLENDPAFQVWMRLAGLPTFSKLAQRNDTTTMKSGTYNILIDDYFPVTEYDGTKSIVITTRTVMGGRNPFLGIAYVVVAGICVILGTVFTATHLIKPRKLGDHTYLSWNNDQSSSATTTGRDNRMAAGA